MLDSGHRLRREGQHAEEVSGRVPAEGLDLVESVRSVRQVADDLGIGDESIYQWRRQDRIDRGLAAGLTSVEKSELAAAKRRIRELEDEVAILKRSRELRREPRDPKGGTQPFA